MTSFRLADQQPPEPRHVAPGVVMRYEGIYEVDPALMQEHVRQQPLLDWDHQRIARARADFVAWMEHDLADKVLSGQALLDAARRPHGEEEAGR